jgi:hypothetical protein
VIVVLGTIGIVVITIAIGMLLDRKYDILPRPEKLREAGRPRPPAHAAGEAPATAIRATSAAQLERLHTGPKCPECRTVMSAEPDDKVRFAGRELLVLSFRCATCATHRAIYVEVAS